MLLGVVHNNFSLFYMQCNDVNVQCEVSHFNLNLKLKFQLHKLDTVPVCMKYMCTGTVIAYSTVRVRVL